MVNAAADVQQAIKVLDEIKPGWDRLIDLQNLHMESIHKCVLGQVFAEDAKSNNISGFGYGVNFITYQTEHDYSLLSSAFANFEDEWKIAIAARWAGVKGRPRQGSTADSVRKAMEALDIARPGWEQQVDLETLDMMSTKECVLGQVFRSESPTNGYSYGCVAVIDTYHDDPDVFASFDDEWKLAIWARRRGH